ncbi:MAG: DsbA family protein [Acidobacteriota bacterium]
MASGATVVLLLSGALLLEPLSNCCQLSADAKQQLTRLVERRFDIPHNTHLTIIEREGKPDQMKVTVFSSTPGHPFEEDLYIISDGRFVVEWVGELSADSERAELAEEKEIALRLKTGEPPRLGSVSAPVTVVIYVDFQCLYCRDAVSLLRERIAGGHGEKLQVLFKHHPLASHDWSRAAARSSVCFYNQSNELFWRFADFLFEHQTDIDSVNLTSKIGEFIGRTPEVNQPSYQSCVASTAPDMAILRDENSGVAAGVNATPTLFVDGKKIVGMGDETAFVQLLDRRESMADDRRFHAVGR